MLMFRSSVSVENRHQKTRFVWLAYVALFLMNIIDLMYTDAALSRDGGSEANPFMNYLYQYYGMIGIAATKAVCLGYIGITLNVLTKMPFCRNLFYGATIAYGFLTVYHMLWFFQLVE